MGFRKSVINSFKGTNYQEITRSYGTPPRPREWHIPILIKHICDTPDNLNVLMENADMNTVRYTLTEDDLPIFKQTLIHESLFSFYKGFYNYLAAKRLYGGGVQPWIEITCYYSKLYLARALTTLLGIQKYRVSSDTHFFVKDIFKIVNPNQHQKLLEEYKGNSIKYKKQNLFYTISLELDIVNNTGLLLFNKKPINSHRDIWEAYSKIDIEGLGITKFTFEEIGHDYYELIAERNRENYSFDGYNQLDFNLNEKSFADYFERDLVKEKQHLVYDETVGIVLGVFQELYHFYRELEVNGLPIELNKFRFMIDYMLEDSPVKEKLLHLCEIGFPLDNIYLSEMNQFLSR